MIKTYMREITERKAVNKFGKIGYWLVRQYVNTNDITLYNKGKRIKFEECEYMPLIENETIMSVDVKCLSARW